MPDFDREARLHLRRNLALAESIGDEEWAQQARDELEQYPDESAPEPDDDPGPSMALRKDVLVALAVEAGLGDEDELEQWTKQELVNELEANEED